MIAVKYADKSSPGVTSCQGWAIAYPLFVNQATIRYSYGLRVYGFSEIPRREKDAP
jgi:hypothetical protein